MDAPDGYCLTCAMRPADELRELKPPIEHRIWCSVECAALYAYLCVAERHIGKRVLPRPKE